MAAIAESRIERGGEELRVRQLAACDADAVAEAFARMSDESRRLRFLAPKPMLTRRELRYLTDIDHSSHDALAALDRDGRIVAIARYAQLSPGSAELAIEVVDDHQGRGLGRFLLERVIQLAGAGGYDDLRATMLWENVPARTLFKALGFRAAGSEGGLLELALDLAPCRDRTSSGTAPCPPPATGIAAAAGA